MDTALEDTAVNQHRHLCQFPGCGKSFIRKEHLTRHERLHTPQRSFVCSICQRGFTRNDILRRHVARHNSSPRVAVRNERACDGCHDSKIRCEGGHPCSLCIKRGIQCKFERDGVNVIKDALSISAITDDNDVDSDTRGVVSNGNQYPETYHGNAPSLIGQNHDRDAVSSETGAVSDDATPSASDSRLPIHLFDPLEPFVSDIQRNGSSMQDPPIDIIQNITESITRDLHGFENISSFNEQSYPRSMEAWGYPPGNKPVRSIPKSVTKERYEIYLEHFHHRWPILHIPSFETDDEPYVLTASVEMIGAWLQGSCASKMIALTLHDRLSNHIFRKMYQKSPYEDRYKPWLLSFYQATLLNVIFGFYFGEKAIFSRVKLLLSMLISSLRDLGFFRSEIAELQERDATFYPYIMTRQEERKRLATGLFKIDCYFSIIRNEPMTLQCQELYFPLPATFSLFNGPGLNVLETRLPDEPIQRKHETVSSMISDHSFSSIAQPFMLVEDIQLGICAFQALIWQYSEKIYNSLEHDISSLIRQKSLLDGLNSWKRVFDQTTVEDSDSLTQTKTNNIPLKFYYGVENHSEAGWEEIVLSRPRSLLFDTAMLYHIFGLHIHANVRSFETLASNKRDYHPDVEPNMVSGNLQVERAHQWTTVPCSRQAIWHASSVLTLHRTVSGQTSGQIRALDPISHVAIAVSSLVVWAYCYFKERGCEKCTGPADSSVGVGLTELLTNATESARWVEFGGRTALDGHTLCRCNAEELMRVFQQRLPSGSQKWALAESLSPVLKDLT